MTPPELLKATARAARMLAGLVNDDGDKSDWIRPLYEARADSRVEELALALACRAVDLARAAYGDRASQKLDQFALSAVDCVRDGTH